MAVKVFLLALILGLATALPSKHLSTLRSQKNVHSDDRLGIFGGNATTIDKHNYLVSILWDKTFSCSGAIISPTWVITIAATMEYDESMDVRVIAGSNNGLTGKSFTVGAILTHSKYTSGTYPQYDFTMVKIDDVFQWGKNIGYLTLPTAPPKAGEEFVVVGYGATAPQPDGTEKGKTLRQGTMKYLPGGKCKSYYTDYMLSWGPTTSCAYNKGKTTMCDNDFGNPFTKDRVLYALYADAGSDNFCTSDASPVIVANIYPVLRWINEALKH